MINNIPDWFLNNTLNKAQKYAFEMGEKKILRETEKAVLIKVTSDFGSFSFWCPKSVLNREEIRQHYTYIEIDGKKYAKEILLSRPLMLKKLNLTAEQVAVM